MRIEEMPLSHRAKAALADYGVVESAFATIGGVIFERKT